jgi:hypothetical protein
MSVEDLEQAVASLPIDELRRFREWFAEFDAQVWDRELERDATKRRLDALAEAALAEVRSRRASEL